MRLEVRNLVKEFPAVRALDGVTLAFQPGTVHGIVGENGAGKSTLMKILNGIEQPTSGSILIEGNQRTFPSAAESIAAGIAMIHQELNLIETLTVAENIFLGREPKKGPFIDRGKLREMTREVLDKVGAKIDPDRMVEDLSLAQKQMVEIAKAVAYNAEVVIMDEPTAVLSSPEVEALFKLISDLRDRGVTVLYISHILNEVIRICNTISVMRDGKLVETVEAGEATPASLAKAMVGREIADVFPPKLPAPSSDPALEVLDLHVDDWVDGVSLSVRPGEIVGLGGLIGAGRTELAEAIVGLRRSRGTMRLFGKPYHPSGPASAMKRGVGYVSEDRKGKGLVLEMNTVHNTTLANLKFYGRVVTDHGRERTSTAEWIKRLGIRANDPQASVRYLSGGNQQKVSVAKWLDTKPKVLIVDEPTRGVDVGAKREMYSLIHDLAKQGEAVIVISSEMPELIGLCHRVLVMRHGKVVGELEGADITEERMMVLAAGVDG
ncbi:MAG: Galactose/methyl galactoside import ATP-binding protein MglA [Fimbriimonadaceae bacterium]|nr:Galactose/methyl galactoside import ATP-binding protein MglA [Fimbriimonadaceae bacterium]